ncbi:ANK [Aspergillus sclerotialis]|uniref:ANK n=1 Tax=Aspergillus sclerotialis TaxID=2070753 RepID=A0A3A3A4G7_9EURO|nr:ANK [Aspergillus sclerotialis]
MSLANLPNELLLEIASNISSEQSLASFAQVNRRFYETLISSLYWRDAKYSNGLALFRAIMTENLSTLEKALQAWRHVNKSAELPCIGYRKKTLLRRAVENNNSAQVQLLLAYGADPNARDLWDRTPLEEAIVQGHLAVVKELLGHENIDLDFCNSQGLTPILIALQVGRAEVVKLLRARAASAGSLRNGYLENPPS